METTDINQLAQKLAAQQPQQSGGDLLFGLTLWGIVASVVFGGLGLVYFRYGKVRQDFPMIFCGIAMMVYPYFVSDTLYIVLIGAALAVLPSIINRF